MAERPDPAAAALPSKSPMEESADALAGVEGAFLTGPGGPRGGHGQRPAPPPAGPARKRPAAAASSPPKGRSDSIDRLMAAAGSLLQGDAAVPDPMAVAAAAAGAAAAASPASPAPAPLPPPPRPTDGDFLLLSGGPCSRTAEGGSDDKKAQITYHPDIAMTKEQLTAWRREMRRVRNRESAAASRRKVRDRIEELEDEVAVWKRRYQEVLGKLGRAAGGGAHRGAGGPGGEGKGGGDC